VLPRCVKRVSMTGVDSRQLKEALGGIATLVQAVPVKETFKGSTVWEGVLHVFDLVNHPRLCVVVAD
jgi:hypothetical protein